MLTVIKYVISYKIYDIKGTYLPNILFLRKFLDSQITSTKNDTKNITRLYLTWNMLFTIVRIH